jgi:hypothetical protein
MRRLSMATRDELLAAVSERYRASVRADKSRVVDDFAAATGYQANMAAISMYNTFLKRTAWVFSVFPCHQTASLVRAFSKGSGEIRY